MLDFLIFWPEYCVPLQKAGLVEIVHNPALRHVLNLMITHGADTARQPEYLLAAPLEAEERSYVVARLMQPSLPVGDGPDASPAQMFAQLLFWVQQQRQRQGAARLQRQILEAERNGDSKRLLELLRAKQLHEEQKGDYS